MEKITLKVLAMVKWFGVPIFFLTSCADLWLEEFPDILRKLKKTEFDYIMIFAIF